MVAERSVPVPMAPSAWATRGESAVDGACSSGINEEDASSASRTAACSTRRCTMSAKSGSAASSARRAMPGTLPASSGCGCSDCCSCHAVAAASTANMPTLVPHSGGCSATSMMMMSDSVNICAACHSWSGGELL